MAESILIMMFRDCPFCGTTHRSPFVDELETVVLACRERARPEDRGSLDAWVGHDTLPVRSETEAFSRSA
jgi:hypothetical protein